MKKPMRSLEIKNNDKRKEKETKSKKYDKEGTKMNKRLMIPY